MKTTASVHLVAFSTGGWLCELVGGVFISIEAVQNVPPDDGRSGHQPPTGDKVVLFKCL